MPAQASTKCLHCSKKLGKSRPTSEFSVKPNGKPYSSCSKCKIYTPPKMGFLRCSREWGKELPIAHFERHAKGKKKGQWYKNCNKCKQILKKQGERKQTEKIEKKEREEEEKDAAERGMGLDKGEEVGLDDGYSECAQRKYGGELGYSEYAQQEYRGELGGLGSTGDFGGEYQEQYSGYEQQFDRHEEQWGAWYHQNFEGYQPYSGNYPDEGIEGAGANWK